MAKVRVLLLHLLLTVFQLSASLGSSSLVYSDSIKLLHRGPLMSTVKIVCLSLLDGFVLPLAKLLGLGDLFS